MIRNKHLVLDEQVKLYIPLWWHGQKSELPDSSPTHCDLTPSGAYFKESGYYFDGTNDHLIDADGRKVLENGTMGEWGSILLTDGEVPPEGSVQGTGAKLYLNTTGAAPKITGSIVLNPEYCPNLINLHCYNNSISVLDVSALTNLIILRCYTNSISVLDVSALTNLTGLYCTNNSISVLDVSALTNLINLHCYNNSISVLDVSALTNLINLYCTNNSMNQAMVDTILCDVDGYGTNNGTLNISNNAAPSAAGITCKNNLVDRGWTVTTD
jgi:Leucine-rich repeat (LRR) protein